MLTIASEDFEIWAGGIVEDYRTGYSGRGMYGGKCVGIVGSMADFINFVKSIAERVYVDEEDEAIDFWAYLDDVEIDSMGLDSIFYWPRVQVKV